MSKWQPNQLDYLEQCHKDGAFVCVALGYKGVIKGVQFWKNWK